MNQSKKIYKTEREGQIEFFDNYDIPWEENDGVLVENCDGVYNGVLFEFKLNINDLNKTLFQAVKYLSQMRLKGESVPAVIILVDLNARKAYVYHSEDYRDDIQKVYVGPASKNNAGFSAKPPVDTYDYDDDFQSDALKRTIIKDKNIKEKYMAIDIDENCVLGWAERFYRELPKSSKGDFLGDEKGSSVKITGEIREPKHFAGLIRPYTKETNKDFRLQMDCLNDRLSKKDLGAFYTHPKYARFIAEEQVLPAANAAVKAGKDYVILDRCAGSGNLETALIGLKDDNGDELISHCIVSTYEYWEYRVLNENIGNKVRHLIPSTEANVKYLGGKVLNADAMSEEYINNKIIKQYLDDENCAIILLENPPYQDSTAITFTEEDGSRAKSDRTGSFVNMEYRKHSAELNEGKASAREIVNLFIWSGFKYYQRCPEDSYILFSPVKYFKNVGLALKKFNSGYLLNRKHFHATESATSCIWWNNIDDTKTEEYKLAAYDIVDDKVKYEKDVTIKKSWKTFAEYYDKRAFADDVETTVWCAREGVELENPKADVKAYYNDNLIANLGAPAFALDAKNRYLVRASYYHHGCVFPLRKDNYKEKLPLWVAKYLPIDNWYEKDVYNTTSDGGDAYTKDDDFLKSCLLYTCLSNQNKCLSFLGSDGRMYQNELCLDNSRYEKAKEEVTQDGKEADADAEMLKLLPVAYQDMMAYGELDDDEKELLELWKKILVEAKQTEKYNPELNYGVYQITKELNTFTEEKKGKCKKKVYDYPQLNGDLNTLRTKLKEYYISHIKEKMFKYQLIK